MTAKIAAPVISAKISHKVIALFYRTVDAVIRYLQRADGKSRRTDLLR
jgi:hypothetical protein